MSDVGADEPLEIESESGEDYLDYALALLQSRNYEKSFEAVKKAIDLSASNSSLSLELRGTFYFLQGNLDKAQDDLMLAIQQQNERAKIKLANLFMEKGLTDQSLELIDEAINVDLKNPKTFYHRGQVLLK